VPIPNGSFEGWLRLIAENNLRDAIKELRRDKRPPPEKRVQARPSGDSYVVLYDLVGGTATTPSRGAAREEAKEILERAITARISASGILVEHWTGNCVEESLT